MNDNLTYIAVVLDRSGSMSSLQEETIKGLNSFINNQKEQPGETLFSLFQFDHEYFTTYNSVNIKDIAPLTKETYQPRGWTALVDAIGRSINSVGNKLALMPEADRPSKVIFVIQTDGEENKSTEFTYEQVKSMVEHQTAKYNWQFMFLGANIDAFSTAAKFGFLKGATLQYCANATGTGSLYRSVGMTVNSVRRGNAKSATFSQADRDAQDQAVKISDNSNS